MTTYKLVNDPLRGTPMQIVRSDGWTIPFNPANTDYQAYLKWLSEGNEPIGPDASIEAITPLQADDNTGAA